jgi:hypothetical protein
LSSGFPKGALSRCRTLHELAVTSIVIAEHGREAAYSDLLSAFYSTKALWDIGTP